MISFNFSMNMSNLNMFNYGGMYGFGTACSPMAMNCMPMNYMANSLFSYFAYNPFGYNHYRTPQNQFAELYSELHPDPQSMNDYSNFSSYQNSQSYQTMPVSDFCMPQMNYDFNAFNSSFNVLLNSLSNNNSNNFTTLKNKNSVRMSGNLGKDTVAVAKSYIGYKENDNSYKLFTNGKNQAWCADFVTHVVKETYKENGKQAPVGFGSSSVEGLRQWGLKNNCYFDITKKSDKSNAIANNVKSGDVVIFKNNGSSHTGVVAQVNPDGSFSTVEGNTTDKVANRNYSANNGKISGFIQIA